MDRSTQIIAVLFMLCFGLTANAQHGKKQKGIQAYPIYYLQGLEFAQDSSVVGLYGWIKPEDRMAVFQGESNVVALVMDTLSSLPEMSIMPLLEIDSLLIEEKNLSADSALIYQQMSLDSIYYWDDYYDYDPDWSGTDSTYFDGNSDLTVDSMQSEIITLDSMQTDTLSSIVMESDSLGLGSELALGIDTLAGTLDSLEIGGTMVDSLQISTDSLSIDTLGLSQDTMLMENLTLDSLDMELAFDTIPPVIDVIARDSVLVPAPIEMDNQAKDSTLIKLGSDQGGILLKSDESLLGDYRLSRPELDTNLSRRRIMVQSEEVPQTEKQKTIESRVDTVVVVQRIIEQSPAVVTERIVERPAEYTGQYAGLSKAERERQLRLDAEERRKAEAAEVSMEQAKLDAELSVDDRVQEARMAQARAEMALAAALAAQSKEKVETAQVVDSNATSTDSDKVGTTVQRNVTVQNDKGAEKAVAQLTTRLEEQAAKAEQLRAADKKQIEGRFDRIESKMDTLLNALGKKVVMNEAVYSIPKEEMNIYFAINSHAVSAHSLMELESYLGQLKNQTDYRIVLSGFADSSGNLEYNKLLVSKRIASVKEAILTMGISPTELLVNNYGKQKANAAKTFNQLDRKVAIQIFSVE